MTACDVRIQDARLTLICLEVANLDSEPRFIPWLYSSSFHLPLFICHPNLGGCKLDQSFATCLSSCSCRVGGNASALQLPTSQHANVSRTSSLDLQLWTSWNSPTSQDQLVSFEGQPDILAGIQLANCSLFWSLNVSLMSRNVLLTWNVFLLFKINKAAPVSMELLSQWDGSHCNSLIWLFGFYFNQVLLVMTFPKCFASLKCAMNIWLKTITWFKLPLQR